MGGNPNKKQEPGLLGWINYRFPLTAVWEGSAANYYAPKNFNFWYYFGSLALLVLVNQIVTGIFLTMHFDTGQPFESVAHIERNVHWGWLIRNMHVVGASAFFVVIYLHMFRALLYGSYQKPRELIWLFGMLIFVCLMAEAFMGYVLPWGQMSYWGAKVIINLFGAIPYIGPDLVEWIQGDYQPGKPTVTRFFALHVIAMPLVILGLVVAHLIALHETGSNNPDGVEISDTLDENGNPRDGITFHPYYTVKDIWGVAVFALIFFAFVFFAPEGGGLAQEPPNFEKANNLKTPDHIAPVWYFTAFYSMLRAIPDQLGGVIVMGAAIVILFFLPWLDRSPVRSIRYKGPLTKILLLIFAVNFVMLSWLGLNAPSPLYTLMAQIGTAYYFGFFLLMPIWTRLDSTKPVPDRVTYKAH